MNLLLLISLFLRALCEYGSFENHLLSGKLIIVTDGICNIECQKIIEKISKITSEYYIADIQNDKNAKTYIKDLNYTGDYPVYFFKGGFLSDIDHDEELASLLKDL